MDWAAAIEHVIVRGSRINLQRKLLLNQMASQPADGLDIGWKEPR
jgi:hypothetical protein